MASIAIVHWNEGSLEERPHRPIYHFNVEDGASVPDEEGCELPDLDTAKRAAMVLAGEMIREQSAGFWERPDWRLFVTDAAGQPLCTLHFTGVVAPTLTPAISGT